MLRNTTALGFRALALLLAITYGERGRALPGSEPATPARVVVMTRNVYHGGQFGIVSSAAPFAIRTAIDAMWAAAEGTGIPTRARAIAGEIAAARPDLVGLQEVALWRTQIPGDGTRTEATQVAYDLLALIVAELHALGAEYQVATTFTGVDVELTGASGNDYRFTDRDAILVRAGLVTTNPRAGAYAALLPAPVPRPGGGFAWGVARGWTSVDVELAGRAFRFVSTHLETSAPFNVAQAAELLEAVGTALPAAVVGDFNASTGDPAYAVLVNDGTALHDAWVDLGAPAGPTCCHDAAVRDPTALPGERVDLVLHRGGFVPRGASVVGADPASMRDGLWPSDHAGVVATVELP
jgi:endonuclease/exonuclease/phosphatase family metal-dependent hydrolase